LKVSTMKIQRDTSSPCTIVVGVRRPKNTGSHLLSPTSIRLCTGTTGRYVRLDGMTRRRSRRVWSRRTLSSSFTLDQVHFRPPYFHPSTTTTNHSENPTSHNGLAAFPCVGMRAEEEREKQMLRVKDATIRGSAKKSVKMP
jgi:hypothetical protein